jgi:flavin-dependent dehydrogenase
LRQGIQHHFPVEAGIVVQACRLPKDGEQARRLHHNMDRCDVLVVGGGPAGSSCAWSLARAGLDVRVLDRSQFPRDKTCAGWITPAVVDLLELDVADYRLGGRVFQSITGFQVSLMGARQVASSYDRAVSFGIRRCEFDDYLLRRSGARLYLGEPLRSIRRETAGSAAGSWVVNERLAASVLVGAGGHHCPVARFLEARSQAAKPRATRGNASRSDIGLVVAQEIEFVMSAQERACCRIDPEMPELYFCGDLDGYGWCFRKEDVLNIGLGRRGSDGRRLSNEVEEFAARLRQWGRINFDLPRRLRGHAYLVSDRSPRRRIDDGVLLIGDAAGMAYPASGEGIRPAVETGLLAAAAIRAAGSGRFLRRDLESYERAILARFGRPKPGPERRGRSSQTWQIALGRRLLGWPWFARHIVMDRWFLHTHEPPLAAQHARQEPAHSVLAASRR